MGIAFTRGSSNICKTEKAGDKIVNEMYSFTLVNMCDATITAPGGGVITSVDKSNPCAIVVTMKHATGCPKYTANWWIRWNARNPWFVSVVQIIAGLYIALKGRSMFPNAIALFTGLLTFKIIVWGAAQHELMDSK